jgi:hypothetical protein
MRTDDARTRRVETLATILLAVAAVATAWSTYQSAVWRGEQASHTSRSTAARIESSSASTRAGQLTQVDIATFTEWVDADVTGDTELAEFYEQRFRREFQPAFAAWMATEPRTNPDAPKTPFEMPEYRLAEADEAERLDAVAGAEAVAAADASRRADGYMLAVVLFASSLFFAGISTKVHSRRQREVLLGIGGLVFVSTVVWIATLPISLRS